MVLISRLEFTTTYTKQVLQLIMLSGDSRQEGITGRLRKIEQACLQNVLFIAISGDSQPSYTHIAKFVRELGDEVQTLFSQVLLTCDRIGLIGKTMFAIDGVKLPANASKERSGTHAELSHRADRLDKAAAKIIAAHQAQDEHGHIDLDAQRQRRIQELQREAQAIRHHKGMRRFTLRGWAKVSTQWNLFSAWCTTSRRWPTTGSEHLRPAGQSPH